MLARHERVPRELLTHPTGTRRSFRFGVMMFLNIPSVAAAVIVSKKNYKTATARNRVRRRVHHILRSLIRTGGLSRSVIVFPNVTALAAPFTLLKEEIENTIARVS